MRPDTRWSSRHSDLLVASLLCTASASRHVPGVMDPVLEFLKLFIDRGQDTFHGSERWVAGGCGAVRHNWPPFRTIGLVFTLVGDDSTAILKYAFPSPKFRFDPGA